MPSESVDEKWEIESGATQSEIDQKIGEVKRNGATNVQIVEESGKKYLKFTWPAITID